MDPILEEIADRLEAQRWIAEIWDAEWRLAYLTEDYKLSAGITDGSGIGELIYTDAYLTVRDRWPAGGTHESFLDHLNAIAPMIAHDVGIDVLRAAASSELVLDGVEAMEPPSLTLFETEVKFGNTVLPFNVAQLRVMAPDGRFAGVVALIIPALSGSVLSMLGTGNHAALESTLALMRPARRPCAVLFVDLEGSSRLARELPTAAFYALIQRLVFRIDEQVVALGGVVGKHAGDGASAFFVAEHIGGEAAAAAACVEAMRAIRGIVGVVEERSKLEAGSLSLRFGMHWGAALYVGRLLTGGRTEVTALGEEVNEAARIEACAGGGRALASKALIERLSAEDAERLGVDLAAVRYTPLADVPGAAAKAARDAPSIPVCEL